ncbi:MAG: VOC family protein [Thermoleophilia bacterium]|nr:VOC family protein [Thermoleophilia bacterium]
MATDGLSVTGVDFVLRTVEDLARARQFYGDVLGLVPGKTWGEGDAMMGAEYETGTVTIALLDGARVGMPHRPGGAVALRVDDVPAARDALKARGVEFLEELIDSGSCHQAIFNDPEGNALILHHIYQGR